MTRRTSSHSLLAMGVLAGILVLGACSADGGSVPAKLSPIETYMSAGEGTDLGDDERRAAGDAWLLENEELIARCMKDQGFEYIPHAPTPLGFDFNALGSADLDDPEWIERYGYGIVYAPDRDAVTITDDPNEAIVAMLSGRERAAYFAALSGGPDAYNADNEYDPTKGGCMGTAQIELDARDPLRGDEFAPLQDAVMAFYEELMVAPEIVSIDTDWATCMSEAGYGPYSAQFDPLVEINSDLLTVVGEKGSDAWDDPAMAKLGAREIEVALADFACRDETDYRAKYTAVRTTLEERFVEDNLADLEAFKAAAEQSD